MAVPVLSGATLVLDASIGVTADSSNRISSILDRTANCNAFTQGTDANKPLLTRSDNKGNLLRRSHDVVNWTNYAGVSVSGTTVTASAGTGARGVSNSTTSFLSNMAVTGMTFRQIIEVEYVNYRWCWIGNGSDSVWRGVRVDLQNGLIDASTNLISSAIETVSANRYKITIVMTQATISNHSLYVSFGTSTTVNGSTSITVAGTEQIKVHYGVSQLSSWDSDLVTTTTYPEIAGVNGHRSFKLFGAQQAGTTTLLSSIFSASAGIIYAVVRVDLLGSEHQITRASTAAQYALRTRSANGFYFINSDGSADYSEVTGASTSTTYIVRGRHSGGMIYCAIDAGNGFTEGTGVASGNSADLTGTFGIGALAGTALYGNIVTLQAKNTGTPDTTFETALRASIYGSTSTASTTNLFFCYPHFPVNATITTSTASTGYSIDNTIAGERHEHYRRNADATSTNVDYDLGSGNNDRPDYFLVARADFLKRGDSSNPALSLRGSVNSGYTATEDLTLTVTDAELCGRYNEDVILETSYVNDYRYWRLNIATTATFTHEVSKIYFGNFFDLGRDPLYLSEYKLLKKDQNERKVKRVYKLIYDGITEAKRQAFTDTILKNADVYPVFIYDKNDIFLEGKKLLHCWITSHKWEVSYYKSTLTLELTEIF
jgi:hypothetical protein